jgi:hypothetical protein
LHTAKYAAEVAEVQFGVSEVQADPVFVRHRAEGGAGVGGELRAFEACERGQEPLGGRLGFHIVDARCAPFHPWDLDPARHPLAEDPLSLQAKDPANEEGWASDRETLVGVFDPGGDVGHHLPRRPIPGDANSALTVGLGDPPDLFGALVGRFEAELSPGDFFAVAV